MITDPVNGAHPSGLRIRTPDLARSRPPRWAWERRLVLGYVNLLIGNEGIGKGVLISWVLAQLTRGQLPGDLHGTPVVVGIIADEDSFDGVWTPRLHAAGADLDRVRHLEREDGWTVDLSEDAERLKLAADLEHVRVLFLDALLDVLGVGVDDWRSKQVRHALQPLRALAREFDIAVVGAMHPNKRADSFRQLVSGASAFNAVSRSSLLLAAHPDSEDRRVLVRGKGNLSIAPAAVEFGIASHRFEANDHEFNVPVAGSFATGETTVEELIEASSRAGEQTTTAIGDAEEIIRALIPADGEWHAAKPVYEAGAREQINERAVQRAAKRLGLERRREREFQGAVEWRWPTDPTPDKSGGSDGTVGSDGSANHTRDTQDTRDTPDAKRACRTVERVASGGEL